MHDRLFRRAVPIILAVLVSAAVVPMAAPASAAWSPPAFERVIGGWGHSGVYAWGMAYNPVTDEILVGDYNNYEVRRLDPVTGAEKGAFFRPASQRNGQPYSIAVQPGTGDLFVTEIGDGQPSGTVAVYDPVGTYKYEIKLSETKYHAYTTFDPQGYLWVSDAHYWVSTLTPPKMRRYRVGQGTSCSGSTNACQVSSFGTYGDTTGRLQIPRGVAADADGYLWIADGAANRLVKTTYSGTEVGRYGFDGSGTAPGAFGGDLRGVAVDNSRGRVYVVDAFGGQVEAFDLSGNPVSNLGAGIGTADGQFGDGGRQAAVVPATGDVWVADYGNMRVHRFGTAANLLGTYPNPARPAPAGGFNAVRDVAVDKTTGDVSSVEVYNFRTQRFAPDGSLLGQWGYRGSDPPYGLDYPRGISVDPATQNIWIANTRSHNIRVYDRDMNYLRDVGNGVDSASTGSFRWPNEIEFWNGRAIVSDYNSGKLKILNASTGAEITSISRANNGIAVNPANGDIYLVSYGDDTIRVYNSNGSARFSFGGNGTSNGKFQNPWDADIVNGVLYVTDTQRSDVQAFDLNGTYLGKFGSVGQGTSNFTNPSGIDHDAAGNLYIADYGNDRVVKWSFGIPATTGDTTKPVAGFTAPADGSSVIPGQLTLTGTATDNVRIGKIEVSILRNGSSLFWDGRTSTWSAAKKWNLVQGAGSQTAQAWTLPFNGSDPSASYTFTARVTDAAGNISATLSRTVNTTDGGPPDTTAPDATISVPVANQVLGTGQTAFSGAATDDFGVSAVRVAIQRKSDNLWWRSDNTWGAYQQQLATLSSPGAASTGWSYQWTPDGDGDYSLQVEAADTSANKDPSKAFRNFSVSSGPDTVEPDSTVTSPTGGQVIPQGVITLGGGATDKVGVAGVKVAIQRQSDLLWRHADGTWGQYEQLDAVVAVPGAASTTWSYVWTPDALGDYALQVEAADTSSNKDSTKAWVNFSVAADTVAPDATVTAPTPGQVLALGSVGFAGNATDNFGVASVRVAIQRKSDNLWWHSDGTWGGYQQQIATLDTAGAPSTGWSYPWTPTATGSYGIQVEARDAAVNKDPTKPWVGFTIS